MSKSKYPTINEEVINRHETSEEVSKRMKNYIFDKSDYICMTMYKNKSELQESLDKINNKLDKLLKRLED